MRTRVCEQGHAMARRQGRCWCGSKVRPPEPPPAEVVAVESLLAQASEVLA